MITALYSILIFALIYWIPGYLLLAWTKTKSPLIIFLAIPVGIAMWGWQGWIFGWLGIQAATYVYILFFLSIFLAHVKKTSFISIIRNTATWLSHDKLSIVLIVFGVIAQSMELWNVLQQKNGIWVSCCSNINDSIWYASITRSILESFPPHYPGITGQILQNYHYWSNLVIADIVRVFSIDQILIQFRYSGVLLSASLGFALLAVSDVLVGKKIYSRWLLFFFYFGGDMIYMISILQNNGITFPGSSLEDGIRFLGNPPRAYAVVLTLAWIALFSHWRDHLDKKRACILAIVLSSIIGFKVYLAFFLLVGLLCITLVDVLKKRRQTLYMTGLVLLLCFVVYLPVNSQAGGLFSTGFWRFENFIVQPGFSLFRLELARKIFEEDNKYIKVLFYDLLFMTIYCFATFGTKLVGLIPIIKTTATLPNFIHILLIPSLLSHFIIGSFFQQSTGGSNTFNFLVNVFLFLSLYTALFMTRIHLLLKRYTIITLLFTTIVIFLTIPRAVDEIYKHIKNNEDLYAIMSPETQSIVSYLHTTPKDSLVAVYSNYLATDKDGPFLYFFSGRQQYLSAPPLLTQFGADTFDRERNINIMIKPANAEKRKEMFRKEKIDYLLIDTQRYQEASLSSYWLVPVVETIPLTLTKIDFSIVPTPQEIPMQ